MKLNYQRWILRIIKTYKPVLNMQPKYSNSLKTVKELGRQSMDTWRTKMI